ncbi:short-chain dehydrogenase/reductase [Williamsia muralis]|uniref:short-chain dehydrogenase/reductase n=1 Tax=Williamsia marianensis TaxID=85044 RepID=UPI0038197EDA
MISRKQTMRLRDSVALITGGAQGIGLATARQLHENGAQVVLVDIDGPRLSEASKRFGSDRVLAIEADVRSLESMTAAVDKAVTEFGRLDISVVNAGVTPPTGTLRSIEPAEFEKVIDINLMGAWNTVRACVEPIIEAGGHIQIIASCAAFAPGMGGAAYMISKSGVEQLGRALRLELAPHGASAGLAYFGIVETELARATLDADPIGREIGAQLPWPLNKRIDVDCAANTVSTAIAQRKPSTVAPRQWIPYALLRGLINPVLDARLARDRSLHRIIRSLDSVEP